MLSSLKDSLYSKVYGPQLVQLKVVNDSYRRLKVKVDCHRRKTDWKFSASGKGTEISKNQNISMFYVVDTSKSFIFIEENESQTFTVEGKFCYISACDDDDVPLFLNHPMPVCPEIVIKSGIPVVTDEDVLKEYMDKVVVVSNDSSHDIRIRVDCDEGVASIDNTINIKGINASLSNQHTVYYQADKQGFTSLKQDDEVLFFIDHASDSCYLTLQYIDNRGHVIEYCNNHRAQMLAIGKSEENGKVLGLEFYKYDFRGITRFGPYFCVKNAEIGEGIKLEKKRFLYQHSESFDPSKCRIVVDNWRTYDEDDDDIALDFSKTKVKCVEYFINKG